MSQKILAFSGKKQAGKNTCANFVVGTEMMVLNLIEYFTLNELGKLVVPAQMEDGSIEDGIFDLDRKDEQFIFYLAEKVWPYVKLYSFADPLKEFCINVLGLEYEQCYGTDEQKNSETHLRWENMPGVVTPTQAQKIAEGFAIDDEGTTYNNWVSPFDTIDFSETVINCPLLNKENIIIHQPSSMTAREVLQYFGTNICRRMYDNVWADACIRKVQSIQSEFSVITDCRFPDEAEAVQNAGGKVVRLTRQVSEDQHESEKALDDWDNFDFVIDNQDLTIMESTQLLLEKLKEWNYVT